MKTITALAAAATLLAGVGAVAAQDARSVGPETFLSVVPFAGSTLYSGRSAHVSPTDTARVYGNGPDGQGMLRRTSTAYSETNDGSARTWRAAIFTGALSFAITPAIGHRCH